MAFRAPAEFGKLSVMKNMSLLVNGARLICVSFKAINMGHQDGIFTQSVNTL